MKFIFIRGLPGTGKTIVSEILGKILIDSKVLCVDKFKLQAMKKNKNPKDCEEIAYKQTLEKLNQFYNENTEYVIIEELVCDKDFYKNLKEFVNRTDSSAYWFRLLRPLKSLLKIESTRKRKIKNSEEDFKELKKDIEDCKIEDEYWIKNDDLALTIMRILEILNEPNQTNY